MATTLNFTVTVRARPLLESEQPTSKSSNGQKQDFIFDAAESQQLVSLVDDHIIIFDPVLQSQKRRQTFSHGQRRNKEIRYVFDKVFPPSSTQQQVFEATTEPLLNKVLDGFNCTVFAYGATGCGKTHTITGTPSDPGVIFLTMSSLFDKIEKSANEKITDIKLSYLEVYNETIRDLLLPQNLSSTTIQSLDLREDENQVLVTNLSEHKPTSRDDVMNLLIRGNNNRTRASTEANAVSSRSHAVLQIHVRQRDKGGSANYSSATLSIIDLAGSERASVTKNSGERLLEGANINRSLLSLGNCISALCAQKAHIPYRDSKLTRLLKFSLGGNCKVVMICNISPNLNHYEGRLVTRLCKSETHSTLKYANRAKNIKTTVSQNMSFARIHETQYPVIVAELRSRNSTLQIELDKALLNNQTAALNVNCECSALPDTDDPILLSNACTRLEDYYRKLSAKRDIIETNGVLVDVGRNRIAALHQLMALLPDCDHCDSNDDTKNRMKNELYSGLYQSLSKACRQIEERNSIIQYTIDTAVSSADRLQIRFDKWFLKKRAKLTTTQVTLFAQERKCKEEMQRMRLLEQQIAFACNESQRISQQFQAINVLFFGLLENIALSCQAGNKTDLSHLFEESVYLWEGELCQSSCKPPGGDQAASFDYDTSDDETDAGSISSSEDGGMLTMMVLEEEVPAHVLGDIRNLNLTPFKGSAGARVSDESTSIIREDDEEATPTISRVAGFAATKFTPVQIKNILNSLLAEVKGDDQEMIVDQIDDTSRSEGSGSYISHLPRLSLSYGDTSEFGGGPLRCSPARRQARNGSRRSMIPVLRPGISGSKTVESTPAPATLMMIDKDIQKSVRRKLPIKAEKSEKLVTTRKRVVKRKTKIH